MAQELRRASGWQALTLLISNDDVASAVSIQDCVDAIKGTYAAALRGDAASRPRATYWAPLGPGRHHNFATLDGIGLEEGTAAIRVRSDVGITSTLDGGERDDKYGGRPGLFCGLVLLFSLETGEPLAIMNDGLLQQMRVAATSAVAAQQMVRPEGRTLGLIGSGHQARAHAEAFTSALPMSRIVVHSPRTERRDALASELSQALDIEVDPLLSTQEVLGQADVVAVCTNSRTPVLAVADLRPGTHVTSVRHWGEMDPAIMDVANVVVHQHGDEPDYLVGSAQARDEAKIPSSTVAEIPEGLPTLFDLLAGDRVGRADPLQITYFLNNRGSGLQFVACATVAYRRAVEHGLGRNLPTDWFLQATSS